MVYPCCEDYPLDYRATRHATVRLSTPEEREHLNNHWYSGQPMVAKKYIVVDYENPKIWLGGFGLAWTEDTKEEIVFWAERWCGKNGGHFIRPKGFKKIVGKLNDE